MTLRVRGLKVTFTGSGRPVPAVRGIFERRFGSAKLESGAELVSIATGLALLGAEEDLDDWSERAG